MHQMRRIEVRVEHVSGPRIQPLRVPARKFEPGTTWITVKVTTPPRSSIRVWYRMVQPREVSEGMSDPRRNEERDTSG